MDIQVEYLRVDTERRDIVEASLRSLGKHDLADLVPPGGLLTDADIAWMIDESATAFDDDRPLDGLTSAERALQPKWSSKIDSEVEYWSDGVPMEKLLSAMSSEIEGVPV